MNNNLKAFGIFSGIGFILAAFFRKHYFLRAPLRNIPKDDNTLISPANGKVIAVKKFDHTGIPNEEQYITELKGGTIPGAVRILAGDVATRGYIISIALNLNNVHYQRSPISGVIINREYTVGSFNNALKYSDGNFFRPENEHNQILIANLAGSFKCKVVQIAGFLARTIEDYVTEGQRVDRGEIIGLINFGSQVTVIVPDNVRILIKPGDILIDGETKMAEIFT